MVVPYGFGNIFLEGIFLKNLTQNGMQATLSDVLRGMIFPAIGMIIGLLTSIYAYRKPREYNHPQTIEKHSQEEHCTLRDIIVSAIAIITTLIVQLYSQNIIASALAGFCIFTIGGVVHWREADDVVTQGFKMMSLIAFIMIAAAGFSEVLRATGDLQELVTWLSNNFHDNKFLAVLGMLIVGLLITLGIGSSFSTVPIIAGVYVPFCSALGLSTTASICVIAASAVIGDAGSPVSDTMLGISAGLNADGQNDHILDTSLPALLHFNIPVIITSLIGVYVL
jgi:predicted histidine transporter YuiF (NhaC family)